MLHSPFTRRPQPEAVQLVSGDHQSIQAIGRIDRRLAGEPRLIWQATELAVRFSGRRFGLAFAHATGQNCFTILIDGQPHFLKTAPDRNGEQLDDAQFWICDRDLGEREHEIRLIKQSEAFCGQIGFLGFLIEPAARLLPKPALPALTMEFFGDSITAGACNQDAGDDQYDDVSTHNNWLSYAAVTARNLGAAHLNSAVSGIGVCASWDPRTMPQIWDRLYVDPAGPAWDFSGPQPGMVVINLGQNDFGFTGHQWRDFPPDFTAEYVKLVRNIRKRYPMALLYCVIGGMRVYEESPVFREAWDRAVAELQADDARILRFVFKAWAPAHPRVAVHARIAEELTAFILSTAYAPSFQAG